MASGEAVTEKPLHVRVAEALGWRELRCLGNRDSWEGLTPYGTPHGYRDGEPYWLRMDDMPERVPRYDTDWSATGPLIEGHDITLFRTVEGWEARSEAICSPCPFGATPLLAVCNLILALHAAGKLDRT